MEKRITDGARQRTVEDLRRRYDFDSMLRDRIIEEGELPDGRYIKYANGRLEFFSSKRSSGALSMTASRYVYYSNNVQIPLNLALIDSQYYVDFNFYSLSGPLNALLQSSSTADNLVVRFIKVYSTSTAVGYTFKLVGRWK